MKIEEFFGNKENVESFLKAKTEKEAREILESKCGKVSDKEYAECKASISMAIDDSELSEAAGGIDFKKIGSALKSQTAQKVYLGTIAIGGSIAGGYLTGKRGGYSLGEAAGIKSGKSTGRAEGAKEAAEKIKRLLGQTNVTRTIGGVEFITNDQGGIDAPK